jgi:SRSO17 transposase
VLLPLEPHPSLPGVHDQEGGSHASRWCIETDYREMEQALCLGDYEGRAYQGLHHHVALVSATHLFCLEHRLNPRGGARAQPVQGRDSVPDRAHRLPVTLPRLPSRS